jgi:LPPG:FO 2-phospho-L-lactate transferase
MLARGMLELAGDALSVVANTGDDVEVYGTHVSPDCDLVTFWLADVIDPRGWGLAGDTFAVMDALRTLGDDVWFALGDRDLAWCMRRTRRLAEGATQTAALAEATSMIGLRARVLPMTDEPVRTAVLTGGEWLPFQEFMVRRRAAGSVEGVDFRGVAAAHPTAQVLAALADAEVIVIGPSNPIASIGPMLALPGLRDALRAARAPVVAVSPIVGGRVLKGPTAAFLAWAGVEASAAGVAGWYGDVLDGFVCDEEEAELGVPALITDTRMATPADRARVAEETLDFAYALAG